MQFTVHTPHAHCPSRCNSCTVHMNNAGLRTLADCWVLKLLVVKHLRFIWSTNGTSKPPYGLPRSLIIDDEGDGQRSHFLLPTPPRNNCIYIITTVTIISLWGGHSPVTIATPSYSFAFQVAPKRAQRSVDFERTHCLFPSKGDFPIRWQREDRPPWSFLVCCPLLFLNLVELFRWNKAD